MCSSGADAGPQTLWASDCEEKAKSWWWQGGLRFMGVVGMIIGGGEGSI